MHYDGPAPFVSSVAPLRRWLRAGSACGLLLLLGGCGVMGIGDDDPPPATTTSSRTRYAPPPARTTTTTTVNPAQVPIASPPAQVVTGQPASRPPIHPASPTATVGRQMPTPPPPAPPRHQAELQDPEDPSVPDEHGFTGDRYLSLVTPDEMDILRLRARGDAASHLSRFLTDKERANLRRRAAELTEIGAEPLSVGE